MDRTEKLEVRRCAFSRTHFYLNIFDRHFFHISQLDSIYVNENEWLSILNAVGDDNNNLFAELEHGNELPAQKREEFVCPLCGTHHRSNSNLKEHIREEHREIANLYSARRPRAGWQHFCVICKNRRELRDVIQILDYLRKRSICGYCYSHSYASKDGDTVLHMCPQCPYGQVSKYKLMLHCWESHKLPLVACYICENSYARVSALKKHMRNAHTLS